MDRKISWVLTPLFFAAGLAMMAVLSTGTRP